MGIWLVSTITNSHFVVSLVKKLQFVSFYIYMVSLPDLFTSLQNAEVSPGFKALWTEKLLLYLRASNNSDSFPSGSKFDNQKVNVFTFPLKSEKEMRNSWLTSVVQPSKSTWTKHSPGEVSQRVVSWIDNIELFFNSQPSKSLKQFHFILTVKIWKKW